MNNRWAEPEGYEKQPPRVRYRIKRPKAGSDDLVPSNVYEERVTSQAWDSKYKAYFHSLAPFDQHFADKINKLIQSVCSYFYADDEDYEPMLGVEDVIISDDEVEERVRRIDYGENIREAVRVNGDRYPLSDLPFDQKRALVEQIEKLKHEWGFKILGELEAEDSKA